jgi:hypothetical protein
MVPPQLRSQIAGVPDIDNPAVGNPDAGVGSLSEMRAQFRSDTDMHRWLDEVTGRANRNNVAIYGVDPRGLAGSEFSIEQGVGTSTDRAYLASTMETIRTLSFETTGRPIVNRNDLTMAMKQIVLDSSGYYLLGYTSTTADADGRFHEIVVRTTRPGVQLRARPGYWAVRPEEAEAALAPPAPAPPAAVTEALAAVSRPARGRVADTWVGSARGGPETTRVTFVWEATPVVPGTRSGGRPAPASVMLTASGEDGTPYFRGRVSAAAPRVTFDASPGEVRLRLSVEGPDAEVLDSSTEVLTVPDLSAGVALGTPAVFRARTVRALQDLKADPEAVPTAAREFARAERVLVRVPAYGTGAGAPTVTARLLNRNGEAMADLPVDVADGGLATVDVPLAGLAAGDYLVEVAAADSSGRVIELVGFRVS